MKVTAYKTNKITIGNDLFQILDTYLPQLEERTVVVITSKIISLCQSNVVKNDGKVDKKKLIKEQAEWYFEDENLNVFESVIIPTITQGMLIANAGIDESNAVGNYIFWPKNLVETTEKIWEHLRKKHTIKHLGIIVSDSHLAPMRYGTLGLGMSWCGFKATQDYRGMPDIFGRRIEMTQKNLLDGFAISAVTVMGEGDEQTPLATITDIPFVTFQDHATTQKERDEIHIEKEKDIYGKLLNSVKWTKGGNN